MTLPVLLVGAAAQSLAARLRLSGYRPLGLAADGFTLLEAEDGADGTPSEAARVDGAPADGGGSDPLESGPASRSRPTAAQAPVAEARAAEVVPAIPLVAIVLSPAEDALIPSLRRRWGAVPILLGSDDDTVEGRSRTLLSGADDFWLTGLGPSDLLTRLRLHRQLLPTLIPGPERLQLADLQVIPASREVSRGGRSLALTAREYQLLLLLLEHRGRVLSREEILRQVWQDQQGSASNVIDVYVRYLRQKLELGGERRLIHTVRGRGYCLSEGPPPPEPT